MLVFFNDPMKLDDPAWNAVRLTVAMRDRTAVEDRVESTPLGDTEFKGLSRPEPIHEVTALR